jgi:hypothetical protein
MNKPLGGVLLLVTMGLLSCLPLSLHPVYRERDLLFDPALLGSWKAESSRELYHFKKTDGKKYRLVVTDKLGKSATFDACLARIGSALFLDVTPTSFDTTVSAHYAMHFVPAHSFLRVHHADSTLHIASMSTEWLKTFMEENPCLLDHEEVSGFTVITSPTPELHRFLRNHADDTLAFHKPTVFAKLKG